MKPRSQRALKKAVLKGIIERPQHCEECGTYIQEGVQGAHYNYNVEDALKVRWLCQKCHSLWDKAVPKPVPAP
jgi:PHP family Zn ribbon phosphoesterase